MSNKNIHVTQNQKGGWNVLGAGDSKPSVILGTQAEAIARGTEIAQNNKSELFIHGRDGKIRERNTFGNDPYPPKG